MLFFKPKVLNINDLKLKFNTFSYVKSDFSDNLQNKVFEILNVDYDAGLILNIKKSSSLRKEEFRIDSTSDEIVITAESEAAAYYAILTLQEVLSQTSNCFHIEDYPDLEIRGVMIDISRSKVPKLETLKQMVKMFSKLRYNHMELYVEGFSFEYKSFLLLTIIKMPLAC